MAQPDLRRDSEERRGEDARRVREADGADLELTLLLRALGVDPWGVVLLLVHAVEDVHAARRAHVSVRITLSSKRKEGDLLREATTDALDADEQEDEGEADAFVFITEYTDCRFERERREDEALDDCRERE